MRKYNRGPGSPSGRRHWAFRPMSESLEDRRLLTGTLDLSGVQSSSLGEEFVGKLAGNGAGYTVTDVGDVTGSGYDDFVIVTDSITAPNSGTGLVAAPTGESAAYLVFGSKTVNSTNAINFLTLTPGERAGDLGTLGQLLQVNPTVQQPPAPATTVYGFNYDGLTLVTGLDTATGLGRNSGLGFSVSALGDINGATVNGNNVDDFLISAPFDAGGGKSFLIYGGAALASQTTKTIDLEPTAGTTATNTPTKVVSFSLPTTGTATSDVGYATSGISDYFNGGVNINDFAIGAPGVNSGAGAVYAISGTYANGVSSGTNVDLSTIGTSGSGRGIIYTGVSAGDLTGAAVGKSGSFDGANFSNGNGISTLVIGAPGANGGAGKAYLVYGDQTYAPNQLVGSTQSLSTLGMTAQTNPVTYPLEGIVFNASAAGARLGFSVHTSANFDGNPTTGVIIGAPGNGTITSGPASTGYAAVISELSGTTTATRPNGTFTLDPNASNPLFKSVYFVGQGIGDLTGYSVSDNYDISGAGTSGILIGAPGFDGGSGTAYVIPGNFNLTGSQSLANIGAANIAGTQLVVSSSFPGSPAYLGTSVSAVPTYVTDPPNTLDGDAIPDIIVGAPGFSLTNPQTGNTVSRQSDGAAFALSGSKLGVGVPDTVTQSKLGVGVDSPTGPYSIATTPNNLTLYVFSAAAANGLPEFDAFADIDPTSIVVNGVAFPNVTLASVSPDPNGLGADASFVVNRSLLNLVAGTTIAFTVSGKTLAGNAFVATASTVNITAGGGGGGGGGGAAGTSIQTNTASTVLAPPIFTGDFAGLVAPPVSTLSNLISYQPIPVNIAYQQFRVAPGFEARQEVYHHPGKGNAHQAPVGTVLQVSAIYGTENAYAKKNTLGHSVFTQSKFKSGKTITFTHKVKVIPAVEQTETFGYNVTPKNLGS